MATTWIKSLHVNKGKTIAQTLADRTDYAENHEKTADGKLVTSFGCYPQTADEEFFISKREYEHVTGRNQGRHDVLAYHIRQSFKPGEVDAETANLIGRKLVRSFTKEKHAFIVATHIDKAHIHNHVIFNSTTLDCCRKFDDFKRSGRAVRRISDLLCAEHGLSIVENPKPSKGRNYAEWLGNKEPSWQEKLRWKIDEVLPDCSSFEDFITKMKNTGYVVNTKRKHITFLAPEQSKPTRLDTLRGNHTEAAIRERIAGSRTLNTNGAGGGQNRVNLLIDIQAKIREGKGAGYEHWAKIHNAKQMAKTLVYLKECGLDNYDDLVQKASTASSNFSALTEKIKTADKRLSEISALQKQIGTYGKTREVYTQYKASGWSNEFYEEHRADITLHRAAKKHFDTLGIKKLPAISSLKQEYAALAAEKKKLYSNYHAMKEEMRELAVAKMNADKILGIKPEAKNLNISQPENKSKSHEK